MPIIFQSLTVMLTWVPSCGSGSTACWPTRRWTRSGPRSMRWGRLQVSTSILDALLPHMSLGYRAYPVGGVQGGKGTSSFGSIEGQNSQQETRRYLVNALNQYNIVVLTQKYSYPEAVRTITKNMLTFNYLSGLVCTWHWWIDHQYIMRLNYTSDIIFEY